MNAKNYDISPVWARSMRYSLRFLSRSGTSKEVGDETSSEFCERFLAMVRIVFGGGLWRSLRQLKTDDKKKEKVGIICRTHRGYSKTASRGESDHTMI